MEITTIAVKRKEKSVKKNVVLDEDTYTENLEKIIIRDFFPDHDKLKDQKEYLEAEENKDFEKMRILALKNTKNFQNANSVRGGTGTDTKLTNNIPTPASFETPLTERKSLNENQRKNNEKSSTKETATIRPPDSLTLNKFLLKYTSEDNDSFETIMEESHEKHKETHAWLYKTEKEGNKILAITGKVKERPLAIEDCNMLIKPGEELETFESRSALPADTWTYKAKNYLMYYPEGVKEDDAVFKKPLEVVHTNTRFKSSPYNNALDKAKLAEAVTQNAKFGVGEKVGHDGNIIDPQDTSGVNGYGFVGTPSPMPDEIASPLMTWGVIENTPARLQSSTPTPGPSFHFLEESKREKLAKKMIDDNSKKKRDKKKEAIRAVQRGMTNTPKTNMGSMERISMLSPAARRLVTQKIKLGSNDRSLKASYTPKRRSQLSQGGLTPVAKTPKLLTPKNHTPSTRPPSESITDNLLKINKTPKRSSAADFF